MELKDRIASVRKAAGLTQEQLGELVGVTRQAVSKWESGQTVPDALTVAKLCEALHVSADYVLLGKEPEEQTAVESYVRPDTCPCCGQAVDGTICPSCGYPLPDTPPPGTAVRGGGHQPILRQRERHGSPGPLLRHDPGGSTAGPAAGHPLGSGASTGSDR